MSSYQEFADTFRGHFPWASPESIWCLYQDTGGHVETGTLQTPYRYTVNSQSIAIRLTGSHFGPGRAQSPGPLLGRRRAATVSASAHPTNQTHAISLSFQDFTTRVEAVVRGIPATRLQVLYAATNGDVDLGKS